jgi:hypothetical protein
MLIIAKDSVICTEITSLGLTLDDTVPNKNSKEEAKVFIKSAIASAVSLVKQRESLDGKIIHSSHTHIEGRDNPLVKVEISNVKATREYNGLNNFLDYANSIGTPAKIQARIEEAQQEKNNINIDDAESVDGCKKI